MPFKDPDARRAHNREYQRHRRKLHPKPSRRVIIPHPCKKCGEQIPPSVVIEGKRRQMHARSYCLQCSPFGDGGPNVRREELDPTTLLVCLGCEVAFPATVFRFSKTRNGYNKSLNAYCPGCLNKRRRLNHRAVKAWAVALMGGKCSGCGYARNLAAMDFHHVDEKTFQIGLKMNYAVSDRAKMEDELKRCSLLCRNCHAEEHNPEYAIESMLSIDELAHLAFKGPGRGCGRGQSKNWHLKTRHLIAPTAVGSMPCEPASDST